jgi:hypothetical protein
MKLSNAVRGASTSGAGLVSCHRLSIRCQASASNFTLTVLSIFTIPLLMSFRFKIFCPAPERRHVEFLTVFHAKLFVPEDFFTAEGAAPIFLGHNNLAFAEDTDSSVQVPRHRNIFLVTNLCVRILIAMLVNTSKLTAYLV